MDIGSIAGRFLDLPPVAFIRAVLDAYGRAAGGLLASGLAYAALFASLPTTLLMLGFAGFIARDGGLQRELADRLARAFPPLSDVVDDALVAVANGAGISSILGIVGLIWGVSQFYGTLDTAFARIFNTETERGLAGRTIRGFLWVLALVGIVLAALVVGTISSLISELIPGRVPTARTIAAVLGSPLAVLALSIVVISVAYRVLPVRAPAWRSVVPFAIAVGIVIVLLTQAFGFLVPILVGRAAVAGSLAAAFVALAWLSFVFQALLLGATCVRIAEERRASAEGGRPSGLGLGGPAAPAEPGVGGQ